MRASRSNFCHGSGERCSFPEGAAQDIERLEPDQGLPSVPHDLNDRSWRFAEFRSIHYRPSKPLPVPSLQVR